MIFNGSWIYTIYERFLLAITNKVTAWHTLLDDLCYKYTITPIACQASLYVDDIQYYTYLMTVHSTTSIP